MTKSFEKRLSLSAVIAVVICSPAFGQVTAIELQKLLASDQTDTGFGYAVAVSGDTAVIGVPSDPGTAYIFNRSGGIWIEQAKLRSSDFEDGDTFGTVVAIDGETVIVGAVNESDGSTIDNGAAYVFTRSGGTWTEEAKLLASSKGDFDRFGGSVAIDDDTAVIGANLEGEVGAADCGVVYVFTRSVGVWTEQARLLASDRANDDRFGYSVAFDGDTIVIGARNESDGGLVRNGAAYVFTRANGSWTEQAKLLASDRADSDLFGESVSVNGDTALIGAHGEDSSGTDGNGAAYVFTRSSGIWTEQAKLLASDKRDDDRFGSSVDVVGDTAVIGAAFEDDSGTVDNGAGYVFTRLGDRWTEQAKLLAGDKASGDWFGNSVAIDGDTAFIGASRHNSNRGAVYVYGLEESQPSTVRIEAEDMLLETYNIEFVDFASNGALINLKGSGDNGSAARAFPGSSGQYDIFVVYHDENDGIAQLTLSIGGISVDSWSLDQSVPGATQPQLTNRFTRQIATAYTVNNGDEIRIDGLQGLWDHANVDYIEFVLAQPQPTDTVRVEAEDMELDTYEIEMLDFASNDALINLKGPGLNGSATTVFPGSSGKYDVVVVYHDENDGLAQLTVSIAGVSLDSWILDQRVPGGAQPQDYNRFSRLVAADLSINNGDTIRIDGLQGNWDHANVDYIEFVVKEQQTPVQIEAESMQLDTYKVETLEFASDGALVNLKGPGLNGSAIATFPGSSGNYDITVVYHDENDGVAQLTVSIAGVSVDSWLLDFRSTEAQPTPANRRVREIATDYVVNNGDEIRIDGLQGNWDHANIDYIKFVAVP